MGDDRVSTTADLQPGAYVHDRGSHPAVIMGGTGEVVTYAELDARSKQVARLLRGGGLQSGDHVAILMENHPRYFEIVWGAQRAGLYTTPINWHLKSAEASYVLDDCGASALFTSHALGDLASELAARADPTMLRLMVDGTIAGYDPYETAIAEHPTEQLDDEVEGALMFYSSGTTGRPKGIMPERPVVRFGEGGSALRTLLPDLYGFDSESVYLCPAPLYHAAPLAWSVTSQRLGATVVVMERFDAEQALRLIEQRSVTHAQFVPTHFIRMLKLPDAVRAGYDHSSLRTVIHAAAPCPAEVKRRMIEWWGPIVYEYYAGSEGNGFCAIGPQDALAHPGSVGRSLRGSLHVLGEDGTELPVGEVGQIWFESESRFTYHNDPEKTARAYNEHGWSSLGDMGYVDAEGYLYLTDRVSHMIISGGVNIYPQDVENELVLHPKVTDAAVIGVPNPDLGEEVKAVVMPAEGNTPSDELASELIAYCRSRIAHYKCPVSVDFVDELPRLPNGKLLKRELRDRYWAAR